MKMLKAISVLGTFYFMMQFGTVGVLQLLIKMSIAHQLELDMLLNYQSVILKVVVGILVASGSLFTILAALMVLQALKTLLGPTAGFSAGHTKGGEQ